MNKEDFLKALAANENKDDANLRMVYADWLDEQGEHEEAHRERESLSGKEWLIRFARENSRSKTYTYDDLLDFGRRAAVEESDAQIYLSREMCIALHENFVEFWRNWSLATGFSRPSIPANREFRHNAPWACCTNEIRYWFGPPHPEDKNLDE
ncbi:MAG: TIGR02996 domain-containing protein [Planctomycetia bacterium]|nr:TIGR02996 domain-containing protein [Planctomycetia bacterium]